MEVEKVQSQPEKDQACSNVAEEEVEELKQELELLMADRQYYEFIDTIAKNKDVVEDDNDNDYHPAEEASAKSSGHGSGADSDSGHADSNEINEAEDRASSSSDSFASDDEEEDRVACHEDNEEVRIPMDMLAAAEKRFPPFWRTKQALRNFEASSYKSEDDLDYVPQENESEPVDDTEGTQEVAATGETCDYREVGGEENDTVEDESEEEDVENETDMKEEVEGLERDQRNPVQPDVNSLVEMVEMMTLPPENPNGESEDLDSETESMDQEEGDEEKASENILTFDADGYVSAEDPDFVPDEKVEDADSSESSEGESSDESSDEVHRME